jgi:hypothetical protein
VYSDEPFVRLLIVLFRLILPYSFISNENPTHEQLSLTQDSIFTVTQPTTAIDHPSGSMKYMKNIPSNRLLDQRQSSKDTLSSDTNPDIYDNSSPIVHTKHFIEDEAEVESDLDISDDEELDSDEEHRELQTLIDDQCIEENTDENEHLYL